MDSDRQATPTAAVGQLDSETLEHLHRATTELYAADSVEECTRQTVSAAINILGFDWCAIAEANEERGRFEITAIAEERTFEEDEHQPTLDEGLVGRAYQHGEAEIVNDLSEVDIDPPDDRIERFLTVPVGEWGVFQALSTADPFDETDLRLVELLVAPLATTIERIQRETALRDRTEKLERQNDQIEAIHAVSTAMKLTTDTDDIYDLFVEAVEQVLDIGICTLDVCEGEVLKTQAVGSKMDLEDFYTETPLDQPDSLAVETYEHGETVVVDNLAETEYRAASSEYRSVISVPLGEWGIFQAATTERDAFDETDRRLIELLADATDAAVERIERENELARRARQLEEQNEQLDQFASRLSHEMRNPLSVLEARTTLARETGDPEHFDHMERSIRRMSRLIDDMLALAREGAVDTVPAPVALDECAREYWDGIRTPSTELAVETDARIFADKGRLHQLLSNLFRNAVEHTGNGVTVTVGDLPDGFYVEDDGSGIAPENRETVLATGTSELSHGTGLGLAVVRRVAEAHDWSLRLTESEEGGARFEFRNVTFVEE
jgi:signal transduction histidine kinase